uniref:Glycoside hydrolase family 76 protein n=1 Tax=Mycena chlorophos TaxID=658473 RepID=A0ABQ0LDN3_MYCCL|nr:glycoside hydrolase family 76 protein [Mycena chlorophos]
MIFASATTSAGCSAYLKPAASREPLARQRDGAAPCTNMAWPAASLLVTLMMRVLAYLHLIHQAPSTSTAPDPRVWRKPEMTTSEKNRLTLLRGAIDDALWAENIHDIGQFRTNPAGTYWVSAGQLYGQMAQVDRATQRTQYRELMATTYFPEAGKFAGRVDFESQEYGRSAIIAYQIYDDPRFLAVAERIWHFGLQYTISQDDTQQEYFKRKNLEIARQCRDLTVAGGTFETIDQGDAPVSSLATGKFMALSALLFEATRNETYFSQAMNSFAFLKNQLMMINDLVGIYDWLNSTDCTGSDARSPDNYGVFIEGLAILNSVRPDEDARILLSRVISATMLQETSWQEWTGIIAYSQGTEDNIGSGVLVRGLSAGYERNSTSAELRDLLGSYLAVQFNAVVELARFPQSGRFSPHWIGPPSVIFSGKAQTAALDVLLASLSLPPRDPVQLDILRIITTGGIVVGASAIILIVFRFLFQRRSGRPSRWSSFVRRIRGGIQLESGDGDDTSSIRSVFVQDGVSQLDGRIIQENGFPLAGGGNANIYRGSLKRSDGRRLPVAIKLLRLIDNSSQNEATLRRMDREVRVWSTIAHPNILPFLGVCNDLASWPVLVSPFCEFGHIGDYLARFPDADRHALTVGAATGLEYLHNQGVIHGDLKVQNVLVNSRGCAVICDFGLSKIIDERGGTSSCAGTLVYMAPELFTVIDHTTPVRRRTTKESDVYSFGLLGLEIFSSQPPQRRPKRPFILQQDLAEMQPQREDVAAATLPPHIWDLFEQCWSLDPEVRPNMSHVVERLAKPRSRRTWFG